MHSMVKSKCGFIPDICSLLVKYHLNIPLNIYVNDKGFLLRKRVWPQFVHSSVNHVGTSELLN